MNNKLTQCVEFLLTICKKSNHPTASFWQEYWFDLGHIKRLELMLDKVLPLLKPNQSVLDIGSFGEFPLILKKFYRMEHIAANSYEGGDIFYGRGQLLREGDSRIEVVVPIEQCNVEKQPLLYQNNSMDIVFCFEVLEHLRKDPMHMMVEINRVLKEDGLLILTTPNASSWEVIAKAVNWRQPISSSTFFPDGRGIIHCREYSVKEIKSMFEFSGFDIEQLETFDCLPEADAATIPECKELKEFLESHIWWKSALRKQNLFVVARRKRTPRIRRYPPLYLCDEEAFMGFDK